MQLQFVHSTFVSCVRCFQCWLEWEGLPRNCHSQEAVYGSWWRQTWSVTSGGMLAEEWYGSMVSAIIVFPKLFEVTWNVSGGRKFSGEILNFCSFFPSFFLSCHHYCNKLINKWSTWREMRRTAVARCDLKIYVCDIGAWKVRWKNCMSSWSSTVGKWYLHCGCICWILSLLYFYFR
jgi:hypothetical protein